MHTRFLMSASAFLLAVLGLAALFLSQELLACAGATFDSASVLVAQILGALYLSFAILNWSARGVLVGGIYSRPVAVGNFFHFTVASLTLIKATIGVQSLPLLVMTMIYAVFAVWFGLVLFIPAAVRESDSPAPGQGNGKA